MINTKGQITLRTHNKKLMEFIWSFTRNSLLWH